jgi:hypothetical protein
MGGGASFRQPERRDIPRRGVDGDRKSFREEATTITVVSHAKEANRLLQIGGR